MKVEEEYRTDEELEAMLSGYNLREPKLTCKCEKAITKMCVNPKCQNNALMCNEVDCEYCGSQKHLVCLSILFKGVHHLLTKRADRQKNFVGDICKIQNTFIQELYKSRAQLSKKYFLGDLQEKYLQIYDQIYNKSNAQFLKGKEGKDLYDRLIKNNEQANQHANLLLENYRNSMKKYVDSMVELKNKVYESFVKMTNVQNDLTMIDSNILRKPHHGNLEEFKLYDSLIVKLSKSLIDELAMEQNNFLQGILNNPKKIELIYRASENSFTAASFHQKCDNIPNTLVLVRTEFGKTIGGFTQYTWNAVASNNYVNEAGKKAFLFSLDLKEKYVPQNENNLICCNTGYGPTFGGGRDLLICNNCHTSNSSANFPSTYNREGGNKITQNQDSYRAFTGATANSNFRVIEYQVFRVTY